MWSEEKLLETTGGEDFLALIFDIDFLSIAYLILLSLFFSQFIYN